jgi:phosphopantetheinyl transferase (holo-ACP synthase)
MLGNDVIDLGDPETRAGASHPRFDARVFTPDERAALASAAQPERLRWQLWALKEAAYKCLKKLAPETCFSPQHFAVRLSNERALGVEHAGRRLRVALWQEGDALHAIATDGADPEHDVLRVLRALPSAAEPARASAAVRALARDVAAAHLGCAPDELGFASAGRAPLFTRGAAPLALDLSLAHHGRFLAAAVETRRGSGAT